MIIKKQKTKQKKEKDLEKQQRTTATKKNEKNAFLECVH